MINELKKDSTPEELNHFFDNCKSKKPMVVFIKAEWCKPCVNIDEVFSKFIEKYKAFFEKYEISIFKIDVDAHQCNDFLSELNILTIPYIALLDNINMSEDNFLKDFSIIGEPVKEYVNDDEFKGVMSNNLKIFVDSKNKDNKNQA